MKSLVKYPFFNIGGYSVERFLCAALASCRYNGLRIGRAYEPPSVRVHYSYAIACNKLVLPLKLPLYVFDKPELYIVRAVDT